MLHHIIGNTNIFAVNKKPPNCISCLTREAGKQQKRRRKFQTELYHSNLIIRAVFVRFSLTRITNFKVINVWMGKLFIIAENKSSARWNAVDILNSFQGKSSLYPLRFSLLSLNGFFSN